MKARDFRRKVLIIEDEPGIRNVLFVLLAGLGFESDVAYTGRQALAMLSKEPFDAVLLDMRCRELPPEQVVSAIQEIRPSLVGRVLVITGEVTDPKTLELLERHSLPHIAETKVRDRLWDRLKPILGFSRTPAN